MEKKVIPLQVVKRYIYTIKWLVRELQIVNPYLWVLSNNARTLIRASVYVQGNTLGRALPTIEIDRLLAYCKHIGINVEKKPITLSDWDKLMTQINNQVITFNFGRPTKPRSHRDSTVGDSWNFARGVSWSFSSPISTSSTPEPENVAAGPPLTEEEMEELARAIEELT